MPVDPASDPTRDTISSPCVSGIADDSHPHQARGSYGREASTLACSRACHFSGWVVDNYQSSNDAIVRSALASRKI
jgi:hypothetical protein